MPEVNLQETFDKVALHLLQQGERSMRVDTSYESSIAQKCAYRGSDGKTCAIGVLIPDELYDPIIEGNSLMNLYETSENDELGDAMGCRALLGILDKLGYAEGEAFELLESLQDVHDDWYPDKWAKRLAITAENHKLSPYVVEQWVADHQETGDGMEA